MEVTIDGLQKQIETWQNEKHQHVAKINMLEGAIQSYRVLIAQIENGAGVDNQPVPDDKQEDETNGIAEDN